MAKICTKCRIEKPLSEFHRNGSHADGRHSRCKACVSDVSRAHYAANAEAIKASRREYRAANADNLKAYYRARNLKGTYKLTVDDYNRILEGQGGLCANPGCFNTPPIDRHFHVDHDHSCCPGSKSCGKCIRGLLCQGCNQALGNLGDDLKRIHGLAAYLETRHLDRRIF